MSVVQPTVEVLVVAVAAAAGLLAFWFAGRFPNHGPKALRVAIANLLAAALAMRVGIPAGMSATAAVPLVSILAVALPGLTYVFLSFLWLARVLHAMIGGGGNFNDGLKNPVS